MQKTFNTIVSFIRTLHNNRELTILVPITTVFPRSTLYIHNTVAP